MKYRKTGPWTISLALSLMVCSVSALASTNGSAAPTQSKELVRNAPKDVAFQVQILVKGLSHPWSLAWLPGGDMLVTEREGRLRRIRPDFLLDPRPIEGLPADIVVDEKGGLFDVAVHPDHARNGWVYLAYAQASKDGPRGASATALVRARLQGHRLVDLQNLFAMRPASRGGRYFGGRIAFDRQDHVF
jgi:glucose/arabinose dehydrogenase